MEYTKEEIRQLRKDFKKKLKPLYFIIIISAITTIIMFLYGLFIMIADSFRIGLAFFILSLVTNYLLGVLYKAINKSIEDSIKEIINN